MGKVEYYDIFYWVKNPDEFEKQKKIWEKAYLRLERIKKYLKTLLVNNNKIFDTEDFYNAFFSSFSQMNVIASTWYEWKNKKNGYFVINVNFATFPEDIVIKTEVVNKYYPSQRVWGTDIKETIQPELTEQFTEMLFRVGVEYGNLKRGLQMFQMIIDLLRSENEHWIEPRNIYDPAFLPPKTLYMQTVQRIKKKPRLLTESFEHLEYLRSLQTRKPSDRKALQQILNDTKIKRRLSYLESELSKWKGNRKYEDD